MCIYLNIYAHIYVYSDDPGHSPSISQMLWSIFIPPVFSWAKPSPSLLGFSHFVAFMCIIARIKWVVFKENRYQKSVPLSSVTNQLTLRILTLYLQYNWQRLYSITAVLDLMCACLPFQTEISFAKCCFYKFFCSSLTGFNWIYTMRNRWAGRWLYGKCILPLRNKLILGHTCL